MRPVPWHFSKRSAQQYPGARAGSRPRNWASVTAAVGSAAGAGAGLPILAVLGTGIYFLVALAFPVAARRVPGSATAVSAIRVRYPDGHGRLRDILRAATAMGFAIDDVQAETVGSPRKVDNYLAAIDSQLWITSLSRVEPAERATVIETA